jgi:hypothetical protein
MFLQVLWGILVFSVKCEGFKVKLLWIWNQAKIHLLELIQEPNHVTSLSLNLEIKLKLQKTFLNSKPIF